MKITLKAARVNVGLSQKELAKKMGVSRTALQNWESGRARIRADALCRFCEITKCNMDDIFLPEKLA